MIRASQVGANHPVVNVCRRKDLDFNPSRCQALKHVYATLPIWQLVYLLGRTACHATVAAFAGAAHQRHIRDSGYGARSSDIVKLEVHRLR